ncbi:MAG: VTT domain-containing protein [Candidatus Heimdallarchaeota archaeon]
MKIKKIDIWFLLLLIGITILSIDLIIKPSHRELIENISRYPPFQNLVIGLLITFWVCLIGNLLPIPTPYTFVVCFSSQPFLQLNLLIPLIVGLVASLGCLVGEMGGYFVGRGASKIISEERRSNLKKYQQYFIDHPRTAPFLLYLFGLTPLNDDMVTIPLGLIKYNLKKTIFWIWLGKFSLMLIFAYNLANICIFIGGESWIISIISLYIIVVLVYLLLRMDMMELLRKRSLKKDNISTN